MIKVCQYRLLAECDCSVSTA